MVAPNGFGSKKSRKNDQNFPNFFSEKKNIKQVWKPSFIKKVQKLAILALSLQDIKNLLCQKMALTVEIARPSSQFESRHVNWPKSVGF